LLLRRAKGREGLTRIQMLRMMAWFKLAVWSLRLSDRLRRLHKYAVLRAQAAAEAEGDGAQG